MRDSAHQLGLTTFWRWWVGQLAPLVPATPRAALQRRRLRPVLVFDATSAVLWEPRPVNGTLAYAESARIDLGGDSAALMLAGRAAIERLPMMAYGGAVAAPNVLVALAPSKMLRKRLVLPAAVEENLKQALAYDLDRHTPFRADELYFDAVVVERDMVKREIVVDWAAARRADVDQARRTAESFGATVIGVTAGSPGRGDATGLARLNLLPEAERVDAAWWRRWRLWVPVALLIVTATLAMLVPIWQKRDYTIALSGQVDQAQQQATAADALRTELDRQMGDYNFVLARKYAYASATQVIDDVTKLLPDDTWLTQFELKSTAKNKEPMRELLLRGESGNAGHLVSLLEESKLFEQAAPRSPTTKIQPGPGEIFDLGAQLKPLPPPGTVAGGDPVPVAGNAPAAADKPAAAAPTAAGAPPAQSAANQPTAGNAPTAADQPAAAAPTAAAAPPAQSAANQPTSEPSAGAVAPKSAPAVQPPPPAAEPAPQASAPVSPPPGVTQPASAPPIASAPASNPAARRRPRPQ